MWTEAHRVWHDARLKEIVSLNAVAQVARWLERVDPPRSGRATEVDPVGGTTASGFVIGRGTVSDLSQNQATKACCCCDCGHVGKAAALSKQSVMSTALASRMPLVPARHTAMGACPPNA